MNADTITRIIEQRGHEVIEVTTASNGWTAEVTTRESAFSIGRWMMNEFEGDETCGFPSIAIGEGNHGFTVEVSWVRPA